MGSFTSQPLVEARAAAAATEEEEEEERKSKEGTEGGAEKEAKEEEEEGLARPWRMVAAAARVSSAPAIIALSGRLFSR